MGGGDGAAEGAGEPRDGVGESLSGWDGSDGTALCLTHHGQAT